MMDLLEAYDKYLPLALDKIEDYYKQSKLAKDKKITSSKGKKKYVPNIKRYLRRAKHDSKTKQHSKTLTKENLEAIKEDRYTYELMLRSIIQSLIEELSEEEREETWDKENYSSLENQFVEELEEALRVRALKGQSTEMPEFIYRGIGKHTVGGKEEEGILDRGFIAYNNEDVAPYIRELPQGKLLFVTTEPSIAAPYARDTRFDRIGISPTNYGDNIYRIRTQGLDPAKFIIDESATEEEALFGPQYIYTDDIPQEMIEVIDTAGNTRQVPRIERKPYPSDENCKDVYFPNHLIDAVKKRF